MAERLGFALLFVCAVSEMRITDQYKRGLWRNPKPNRFRVDVKRLSYPLGSRPCKYVTSRTNDFRGNKKSFKIYRNKNKMVESMIK